MTSKKINYLIFAFIVLIAVIQSVYAQRDINSPPNPKKNFFQNTTVNLAKNPSIHRDNTFYKTYQAAFESLHGTITKYGRKEIDSFKIEIFKITDLSIIKQKYLLDLKKPEAYLLIISDRKITLSALSDHGLLNGLSTLETLIEEKKGKLQKGSIVDFPDLKMRVLHLSLWPSSTDDFKETIRLARLYHFNTLILLTHVGVNLKSLEHLKIKKKNQWSIEQFKEMVTFAKQNGLEFIPEIKLLSHQKRFLGEHYPDYMYNKATYDPRNKALYKKVVFPAIDELLNLTGAKKFHIGHDEVAGWSQKHYRKKILAKREKQLPPELFLKDVLILNDYLQAKGIETWMWSDMLYTVDQFPVMKKAGADFNGYNGYADLRTKIPKDIVLCVWHYRGDQKDFPTASLLAKDGYKILGATWKLEETVKNYSNYITNMSKNAEGMIATTWYGFTGKKKYEVHDIIKFSGRAFWNAK